jgi:flagellar biosynthesis GTPase FlhF
VDGWRTQASAAPGVDHLNLFQNVKESVLTKTGGTQQPWESNGLAQRVFLTGQPNPLTTPRPGPTSALGDASSAEAERAWNLIRESRSTAVLEAFSKQFPGTVYAALAADRLAEL